MLTLPGTRTPVMARITACAALATSVAILAMPACAAEFPSRPIRVVVPFAAGGGIDFIARAISQPLSDELRVPVLVDNRGGANGTIGAELVARANPDGYTLLAANPNFAINPLMMDQKLPFRTPGDFAGVASFISYPMGLGARAGLPIRSVSELINSVKKEPGKFTFATAGGGATGDLAIGLLEARAGVKFLSIPYKGIGPATAEVAGGNVDMVFTGLSQLMPFVKAGRIKLIGTTGLTRTRSAPDIETLSEQGLKDFEAKVWWGLVAPIGTPRAVLDSLNKAVAKVAQLASVNRTLDVIGGDIRVGTPKEFDDLIRSEMSKWGEIITRTNMKAK